MNSCKQSKKNLEQNRKLRIRKLQLTVSASRGFAAVTATSGGGLRKEAVALYWLDIFCNQVKIHHKKCIISAHIVPFSDLAFPCWGGKHPFSALCTSALCLDVFGVSPYSKVDRHWVPAPWARPWTSWGTAFQQTSFVSWRSALAMSSHIGRSRSWSWGDQGRAPKAPNEVGCGGVPLLTGGRVCGGCSLSRKFFEILVSEWRIFVDSWC